jgi:hypothetical protein
VAARYELVQLLAAGRRWLCSRPYLARCRSGGDLCAAISTFGDEWLQKMCVLLAWIYVHLLTGGIGAAPFVSELEEVGQLLPLLPLNGRVTATDSACMLAKTHKQNAYKLPRA